MITLAWARLLHAERPAIPHLFVDRRRTAHVWLAGATVTPCYGVLCMENTGSDDMDFCSDKCQSEWHLAQLQTSPA